MNESHEPQDGATEADRTRRTPQRVLDRTTTNALVGFASQTVVLTAVLFYFGWARVRATYAYFGVDVSVLNFSVSDYVLRSVSTAFPLLIALGALTVAAILIDARLQPMLLSKPTHVTVLIRVLSAAGWGLVVAGFALALVITGPGGSEPPGPTIMLAGFAIVVYALMLRNRYASQNEGRLVIILAGLLFLAFFWSVTAYANFVGIRIAEELQATLPGAPNVTVYSSSNLSLDGPGMTGAKIAAKDAAYQFRYSGLRLLVSSGGQYFLLPAKWRPGAGSVIVLPATPAGANNLNIRVQFQASTP